MGQVGRVGPVGKGAAAVALLTMASVLVAQPFRAAYAQQNANAPANFIKVQAPVVALTHARVISRGRA
jgi:hypothetical protein